MKTRFLRAARLSTYLLFLLVSSLVLLEVVLRIGYGDTQYYWQHRYLFITPGSFENVSDNLWVYGKSKDIREVAVYGFSGQQDLPFSGFRIEYDCRLSSNNLGFLQARDFFPGDEALLILGDSFAAGQGGCPWMHQLEARNPELPILNGGLMGTGIASWPYVLDYVEADAGVRVQSIVIIAISNDFKRRRWIWDSKQLGCLNEGRCEDGAYWNLLGKDETADSLLSRAAQAGLQRHGDVSLMAAITHWLKRNSYVFTFAENAKGRIWGGGVGGAPAASEPHPDALTALARFRDLDLPIAVLLIPQRDEAALGEKNADSLMAERLLQQYSLAYSWCDLASEDYMPLDGHPNKAGYEKIGLCLEQLLKG